MTTDPTVSHLCPPWAFDPVNPDKRPETGSIWQPVWDPIQGSEPMPGFEVFVARLLTQVGILWVYEPFLVPIPRPVQLPDPTLKHFRHHHLLRNDFYLPDLDFIIEVFSGYSESRWEQKHRHLERMSELYGIPYLLLTVQDWELLKQTPSLLQQWLGLSPAPKITAA
jgi:hypothetical protein